MSLVWETDGIVSVSSIGETDVIRYGRGSKPGSLSRLMDDSFDLV